jgi:hypothetical protein
LPNPHPRPADPDSDPDPFPFQRNVNLTYIFPEIFSTLSKILVIMKPMMLTRRINNVYWHRCEIIKDEKIYDLSRCVKLVESGSGSESASNG